MSPDKSYEALKVYIRICVFFSMLPPRPGNRLIRIALSFLVETKWLDFTLCPISTNVFGSSRSHVSLIDIGGLIFALLVGI